MSRLHHNHINIAIKKAATSSCRYKISALGFNKRGELVATATNRPRFYRHGGGIHAEMALMKEHPKSLKTLLLCRVGRAGALARIGPCPVCEAKARDLGIKIITISP